MESGLFALVFVLGVILVLSKGSLHVIPRIRFFLVPLLLLSTFSYLQGFISLFFDISATAPPKWLPYSYDFASSFWSGTKFLAFASVIYICQNSIKANDRAFVWSLALLGNIVAFLGITRYIIQSRFPASLDFFRFAGLEPGQGFGPFYNQNHFALLMLMVLGLDVGLLVFAELRVVIRGLLLVFTLIVSVAIILTASRAGIVGSFAVIGTLIISRFVLESRKGMQTAAHSRGRVYAIGRGALVFGLISIVLVLGVVFIGQDRVTHRFTQLPLQLDLGYVPTSFRRVDIWAATSRLIGDHFVFGVGFGAFPFAITQVMEIHGSAIPKQAHNDYLEFLASGGIISAAIALWFVWQCAAAMRIGHGANLDRFSLAARIGAIGATVGVAFHSLFDFGIQFSGNFFFFGAVIAIATIGVFGSIESEIQGSTRLNVAACYGLVALIGTLSVFCALVSVSRFCLISAATKHQIRDLPVEIPFDAELHAVRARSYIAAGNIERAIDELRLATDYRPRDFELWLRLAESEEAQTQLEESERAYKHAIRLAPHYGEVHYRYGMFLLRQSRIDEAVAALTVAVQADPRFIRSVALAVWRFEPGNVNRVVKLAGNGTTGLQREIIRLLIDNRQYEGVQVLACEADLSDLDRSAVVQQLVERRQIQTAWKVYKNDCLPKEIEAEFINGDFERIETIRGEGFGWMLEDEPNGVVGTFDGRTAASGNQSLRITFNGIFDSPVLSAIVPARRNTLYRIDFSQKSDGIVTGGVPVLRFVLIESNENTSAEEMELGTEKFDWMRSSTLIRTDRNTEAIKITLTKRPCGQTICPIFGQLWLDDFRITQI